MSNSKMKNYGFGRQMGFAIRLAIGKYYGSGRFSTRHSHYERLRPFERFLRTIKVRDLREIGKEQVAAYAHHLAGRCSRRELSVNTARNRLSSVNVLLAALSQWGLKQSAGGLMAARKTCRVDEPLGIFPIVVDAAVERLVNAGEIRLAVLIGLARYSGARFREASLFDLRKGRLSIERYGEIAISAGTKGGRGKSIPRRIVADKRLTALLNRPVVVDLGRCVIPPDWNYKRWYAYSHRAWRKWAANLELSPRIHDLRAAFSCARYQQLTGRAAPCVAGVCPELESDGGAPCVSDCEARQVIAEELGHGRVGIVAAYIGAST